MVSVSITHVDIIGLVSYSSNAHDSLDTSCERTCEY